MLDIDPLRLIARECQIQPGQFPLLLKSEKVRLVKEIRAAMLFAKKKPVASCRSVQRALFDESAERRDAGARSNHDDVARAVLRQTKVSRLLNINRDGFRAHRSVVGHEAAGQAGLRSSVGFVANDGDAEMDLVWMGGERRGNRIESRGNGGKLRQENLRRFEPGLVELLQNA